MRLSTFTARAAWLGLYALLGCALAFGGNSANAARISDVRVGSHGQFTRVVIETDVSVEYEIERAASGEILVTVFAESPSWKLDGHGALLDSVRVDGTDGDSVARLSLREDSVELADSVLEDPPRIVLDLYAVALGAASERPTLQTGIPAVSAGPSGDPGITITVDTELAFHRGVAFYGEGRFDEAREEFARVVSAYPEDEVALQYLGLTAQAQGDFEAARDHFERALALDPESSDLKFDLGTALLQLGEVERARSLFDEIIVAEPQRARAHLYAGIADYRLLNYRDSLAHLEKAAELDPELKPETGYYIGLSYSFLDNKALASVAFAAVTEQSPQHPLGRSAAEQRRPVQSTEPPRPWTLGFTTGAEWDSNPLVVGDSTPLAAVPASGRANDWRGVFLAEASYAVYQSDLVRLSTGYDGFLSVHDDTSEVDLQTHLAWATATMFLDPVRLDLRYDYSYSFVDLSDDFLGLHRIAPSISIREGDWGLSQLVYQFQHKSYFLDDVDPVPGGTGPTGLPFDRDGNQHSVGFNQFFFLGEPIDLLWVGVLGDWNDPQGSEFEYHGFEVAGGAGLRPLVNLLPGLNLSFDYRYIHRIYANDSFFVSKGRDDRVHLVTWSVSHPIRENLEISFAGSYRRNLSNIRIYDYERTVMGTYLKLRF